MTGVINLREKLGPIEDLWHPRIVTQVDYAAEKASVLLLERGDNDQTGGLETGLRADQQELI